MAFNFSMNLETLIFFSTNVNACSEVPGLLIIEVEKHINCVLILKTPNNFFPDINKEETKDAIPGKQYL